MAKRYFIQLSYKGTNYHGWQIQPNAKTIQETLENALSTILREEISITGAGRTDTGVHASFFVAHFDSEIIALDKLNLEYKLNSFLPKDISIQRIWKVPPDSHARYDATSRTYHYIISRKKNPFKTETSYYYPTELDISGMNEAAKVLFEFQDFTSFARLHTDVKTNLCIIYKAEWSEGDEQLVFEIKANRFLRNMVRAIVGTLLEVGKGKLTVEGFREIIEQKNRGEAGASAPAEGLFLTGIEYPPELIGF